MFDGILIAVAVLAIIGLFVIIGRKFGALRQMSRQIDRNHRESMTKEALITRRLERKFSAVSRVSQKYVAPVFRLAGKGIQTGYAKLVELENQYRHRSALTATDQPTTQGTQSEIGRLLNEATDFSNQENFVEAEKRLITLISLDPTNLPGYRKLADLYLETKDYPHAKETLSFVIGLEKKTHEEQEVIDGSDTIQLAADYIDLGMVCQELGEQSEALRHIEQAAKLDPNNPKNLDLLLETSLAAKNKVLAWEAFDRLKQVNPDNQKLADFQQRIAELEQATELKPKAPTES